MNKDSYNKLKEINSLDQENKLLNQKIATELKRVDKLLEMKKQRTLENETTLATINDTKNELQTIENEIASYSSTLTKSESNLNNLIDEKEILALSAQIETLKDRINNLENRGLELLEHMTEYEEKVLTYKDFVIGIQETIDEFTNEIEEENKELYNKINVNQKRIETLYGSIDNNIKEKFIKLLNKNLKHGPLTKVVNGDCFICKYQLNSSSVIQIEDQMKLTSCESCQRIFIPTSCSY